MCNKRVVTIGTTTITNIQRAVVEVKQSVKEGWIKKPTLVIYGQNVKQLWVGLYLETQSKVSISKDSITLVLEFTPEHYKEFAKQSENTHEIAKTIQNNAYHKFKQQKQGLSHLAYDDFLYQLAECLGSGVGLNVIYNQGVASFDSYNYVDKEDMVVDIQIDLSRGKELKSVQIKGYDRSSVYITVIDSQRYAINFNYFGYKDNVYQTVKYNVGDSLKNIIEDWYQQAVDYDNTLTKSKLDKDMGEFKQPRKKAINDMSDEEFRKHLEDED